MKFTYNIKLSLANFASTSCWQQGKSMVLLYIQLTSEYVCIGQIRNF